MRQQGTAAGVVEFTYVHAIMQVLQQINTVWKGLGCNSLPVICYIGLPQEQRNQILKELWQVGELRLKFHQEKLIDWCW